MEDFKIGMYGLLVVNIVLAFLFATFPLVAGILRGNQKRGFLGFVLALAGGALLGILLSFPLAMIFFWLIVKEPAASVEQAPESTV
jgi:hypothetical protein